MGGRVEHPAELVECMSGAAYGERPLALQWEGKRLEVEQVLTQWRSPGGKGFRVQTRGGQIFEVYYDESSDAWQITPV